MRDHYQQGSILSIDQLQAIAILQDLPHDQVLAWYGSDATHGRDADGDDYGSHTVATPYRSSTCSTLWTKRSSSRPSSRSSFASFGLSSDSPDRERRSSRRPPSSSLCDVVEASETEAILQNQPVASCSVPNTALGVSPQQADKNYTYKCTGCSRTFKSMQTWSRHEKEDHEDISFPCMPNGAIEVTGYGRACALCGREPTEEHLRSHNIERCTQLKHVFKRSDHLKQHLESHGLARKSRQSDLLVTKWQRVPDKQAWACGFCKAVSTSLVDFHKHVAVQHYECGEERKWDHTKVILGLLSQSPIAGPWERLLSSRFRVQSLSCKWSKTKSGCLQTRLELCQEPGDMLAEAALECAIYDKDLLHEAFRQHESSTLGSSKNASSTALGPPVPPKPQSFQAPYHNGSNSESNAGHGPLDPETLLSVNQFKTPSPPLFDISPRAWDFYMSRLDQHDWNSYVDPGLIQPMDVDSDLSLGFPS
ncbi:MAG: hypothetical protein Q9213_001506 [Squamulea squamosa]